MLVLHFFYYMRWWIRLQLYVGSILVHFHNFFCTLQDRSLILTPSMDEHGRGAGQVVYVFKTALIILIWPMFINYYKLFCLQFSSLQPAPTVFYFSLWFVHVNELWIVVPGNGWEPNQCGRHCSWSYNCFSFNVSKGTVVNIAKVNV